MDTAALKKKATDIAESQKDRLIKISHQIHEFNELGYEEYKSSALLAEELTRAGFRVEKPIAGLETAFSAVWGSGKPVIGLLGEYDALPELGHACGHNLMGTAVVGAGIVLKEIAEANGLKGTVKVFGCPCEEGFKEGAGGKIPMLEAGAFNGLDVSMMVHACFGKYGVWSKARAREHLVVRFSGRRPSVSESNYDIVNALDSAVMMLNGVYVLKQRKRPESVITYIISEGGVNPNIVPLNATVRLYIRSLETEYLTELVKKVEDVARGAAEMTGATVEVKKHTPTYAASIPNLTLSRQFQENLLELGVDVEEPCVSVQRFTSGESASSTDYGNVSREVPSGTINISLGPPTISLHTKPATGATKSPGADKALLIGVKTLAMTGIDFLLNPKLVKEAQNELKSYKENGFKHPYPTEKYPRYLQ